MNSFKIGDTEFGVGNVHFSIENNLVNLEINGNEKILDELAEEENSRWGWALYPPRIYFRSVPYDGESIVIDESNLYDYDISLYMMEHNDFTGTLKITDENIQIQGMAGMMDGVLPVSVCVERNAAGI